MQGLIAARFGRHKEAREQLTAALALSERAGLGACAAEARLELALRRSQAS
jgi:plasmid stability protein